MRRFKRRCSVWVPLRDGDGDWLYEAKLDGYRVELHRPDGKALAYTRNGADWSAEFAPLCTALTKVTARSAVQRVRERLEPLIRRAPPVAKLRKKDTVWVEPELIAKIEFRGITEDGMLRHPSFKGLK